MQNIVIRKATAEDLADVRGWLERERRETGEGFFCNWEVIESIHEEEMLDVLVRGAETVAFVADGRRGPEIVEVRPDLRGKGLGRRAAEHALKRAYDRGNSVVRIECAPSTSISFWQEMGFQCSWTPTAFAGVTTLTGCCRECSTCRRGTTHPSR